MMSTVSYGKSGDSFEVPTGTRLLDAILAHVPEHPHVCGGNGFCTSCRVTVQAGALSAPSRLERERLGSRCGLLRLACQSYVEGDVSVVSTVKASLIDWD